MPESRWTTLQRVFGLLPTTATGFVVLVASVVALVLFGIQRVDHVLVVAGMAGIVLVGAAHVGALIGAAVIWRRVRHQPMPPQTCSVGRPGRTGFELVIPWWLPLIDVRWTLAAPTAKLDLRRVGRTVVESWTPSRRGEPSFVARWFVVGDVFGIASIRFLHTTEATLRFLPDEGSLRRVEVIQGLASGDQIAHPEGRPEGDLQDMRRYGDGDPIRYVLWKVFAKSRTLVVRTPERALSPIRRTAAYLITSPVDQAAAGTCRTAVECGALGEEWVLGADGTTRIARERKEVLPLLLASADAPDDAGGQGLVGFLESADAPRRIVVFAPAIGGPWVDRLLSVARHTRLEIVLCADAVVPDDGWGLQRVVLIAEEAAAGRVEVGRSALAQLVVRLRGAGDLRIVDRQTGTVYAGAHIERLARKAS